MTDGKLDVWVEGTMFETPDGSGIWRIFYEVMGRTAREVNYTLWLRQPPVRAIPAGVAVYRDSGRTGGFSRFDAVARTRRWLARTRTPHGLRKADVFHSAYFSVPAGTRARLVVNVYDFIAERLFGICGGWAEQGTNEKRRAIAAADACNCISSATSADLAVFHPDAAARSRVILLGADHLPAPPETAGEPPAGDFALFVGNRGSYKNFALVLDAMTRSDWPGRIALRIAGPDLSDIEWRLIGARGLTRRVEALGRVHDARLATLYREASCFVYPSLLEGFGLPLLEAQVQSCPVVCSDIPAFHEIAGAAAVYFDPRLGEKLAEAVAEACRPDSRARLVGEGRRNAGRFVWDRTAEQTLAMYREVAATPARRIF